MFCVVILSMEICEIKVDPETLPDLLALSTAWAEEKNCWGYVANDASEYEGKRVFAAYDDSRMVGYLFGHFHTVPPQRVNGAIPGGAECFEIDELYVLPEYRSHGIGSALFDHARESVRGAAAYLNLGTATKDWRSILNFYMDRQGMDFWSACLYQKL